MAPSKHTRRNIYFKDKDLLKKVMKYCEDNRLSFSHVACEALRAFLDMKEREKEAIKNANIRIHG